jgi:hypothetical protein
MVYGSMMEPRGLTQQESLCLDTYNRIIEEIINGREIGRSLPFASNHEMFYNWLNSHKSVLDGSITWEKYGEESHENGVCHYILITKAS